MHAYIRPSRDMAHGLDNLHPKAHHAAISVHFTLLPHDTNPAVASHAYHLADTRPQHTDIYLAPDEELVASSSRLELPPQLR
jgi:hypothetical protein